MKFFKSKPKECSICHELKPIKKSVWGKGHKFYYCQDCWDKTYAKSYGKVLEVMRERKAQGKKIGLGDTKVLVKEISEDVKND